MEPGDPNFIKEVRGRDEIENGREKFFIIIFN